MLTDRQERVLQRLVEAYLDAGVPVGSKALAESFTWGPSTIRGELASLEELGYLQHPHTSAGRVPTEAGYRYFVDRLLPAEAAAPVRRPAVALSVVRHEVDEAMRTTTETLSQITNLLALVTAPPIDTATIRHIEVIALQPQVLMVVVITSTGGVTKRMFTFDGPVDTGLVDWAGAYLNERLVGTGLGARTLGMRLRDPGLNATEVAFLSELLPVFTDLATGAQDRLYFDGTARLLSADRSGDVTELNALMEMLERRVTVLGVLRSVLAEPEVLVRIGTENELPGLASLSLVAAGYGPPQRPLGSVSVIGPLRMDYRGAIRAVRDAAAALSDFWGDVYQT
ncbi:heat-inducible transcriptional repressor HrcA [Conexibacter sp. DBS9H8]|uniref:heat-inducible transcriptional repressor HrcA n=1 Tax=Conexibacter sp. DBS9H8 TaxID=2937801 RepID=UPI00200CDE03|nr:heat-inducible transcriptional repressor HrcA [Conexibacter sp. DBS9H8]